VVNLSPCLRVDNEQAPSGIFDGNRMFARETVAVGFLWISLTIPLWFPSKNSCNLRIKGVPVMESFESAFHFSSTVDPYW
jgi:hypothetical protein